jgi:thioredoxin-related protein
MKKTFILFFIFSGLFLYAYAGAGQKNENTKYVPVKEFDSSRDSEKDLSDAIAEARRSGRRILLDVGGSWCIWCRKFDKFLEENPPVSKYLEKYFVVVKINYDKEHKNEKFLSKYPKVDGYPHFFILDKKGKFIHSQNTGELESGDSHDKAKVMKFLKKWSGK